MSDIQEKYDVLIVGMGVAGLNAARFLPRDKRVLLISKESPRHSDSYLAQGGICVLKWDGDYDAYYRDTMQAGHHENSPEAVDCMLRSSRETISDLLNVGVRFTRDGNGELLYTREGGHSAKRILYHEDCTGKEITSRLFSAVRRLKNVEIRSNTVFLDLLTTGNVCTGGSVKRRCDE